MLATRGCLPFDRSFGYGVVRFQQIMNSASNGCSGTGPFEAWQTHLTARPGPAYMDH
jgi:hypothetical protein